MAPWVIVGVSVLGGGPLLDPSMVWVARPLLQQSNINSSCCCCCVAQHFGWSLGSWRIPVSELCPRPHSQQGKLGRLHGQGLGSLLTLRTFIQQLSHILFVDLSPRLCVEIYEAEKERAYPLIPVVGIRPCPPWWNIWSTCQKNQRIKMSGMKDWWLWWWWWWGIAGDDGNVGDAGDDDDGVGDGTDRLKAVFCAVRQWLRFQLHREAGAGWDELFSILRSKILDMSM